MIAVNHRQLLVSAATQRGISGWGGGAFGMCVGYFRQAKFVSLQVSHLLSCCLQRRRRI